MFDALPATKITKSARDSERMAMFRFRVCSYSGE